MVECPFCSVTAIALITENSHWYAKYDIYPVTYGHMLMIPKRHIESYFELEYDEVAALDSILTDAKYILDTFFKPDGYNIGMNLGAAAGQTIPHHHIHLIPRYEGDMVDPRGGVRGVIPERRIY